MPLYIHTDEYTAATLKLCTKYLVTVPVVLHSLYESGGSHS